MSEEKIAKITRNFSYLCFTGVILWQMWQVVVVYAQESSKAAQTLRVGAILPFTGAGAFAGEPLRNGMQLALKEHPGSRIEIFFEDGRSADRLAAVTAANKLISANQVSIILNDVVNSITALSPILNKKKIPGIVLWDNNRTIQSLGDYVFGMGVSTELAGQDLAVFAYSKLAVKSVSVITLQDEWSEIISESFIEKFKQLGGAIQLREKVETTDGDLRSLILKIKQRNSEAIFFPVYGQVLTALIRQARELDYQGLLITGDVLSNAELDALAGLAEGVYFVQVWLADRNFAEKYKKAFSQSPDSVQLGFAAIGYDSIKLLIELKETLQQKKIALTPENIRDNLIGFEFNGVSGKTFFSKNRSAEKREVILRVKHGRIESCQ